MTEAEWEAFKGFAAASLLAATTTAGAAAKRAADGSLFYWNLDLDWDKLF